MDKAFIGSLKESIVNSNEFGGLLFDHKEVSAVSEVIRNKDIFRYAGQGKTKVDELEGKTANFFSTRFSLGLNNGTSALRAALFAIDIKPNDRVLVSAYTFLASAAAVNSFQARPIPMDFDFNHGMNTEELEKELEKGCKAIIIVHLQGRSFDISKIREIAHKFTIPIIEDACQAFGAKYDGNYAGTTGDIGVFSFQQNKQITCGEGGLLITDNPLYYGRARNFSDQGAERATYPEWESPSAVIGDNLRMTNIQAAILIEQLIKFDSMVSMQCGSRMAILKAIQDMGMKHYLEGKSCKDKHINTNMNIFFVATTEAHANKAIEYAEERDVLLKRLWNKPFHLHRVFRDNAETEPYKECKNAKHVSECLLVLPIPPILSDKAVDRMTGIIHSVYQKKYIEGWF